MKNLILTFVFALVSLISFTQYNVNYVGGDSTGTIVVLDQNDINDPAVDTIYVNGNVKFTLPSGVSVNEKLSNFNDNVSPSMYHPADSTLSITSGQTKYLLFNSSGTIGHVTVIYLDPTASTSENTLTREELKVYPSPATSDIKISFSADKSDMPLNIFSLNGQLVHQDNTSREVGAINIVELNVSGWSAGIYLANNGKETFKFVVL